MTAPAEVFERLTIPAGQVKAGDEIDVGDAPVRVFRPEPRGPRWVMLLAADAGGHLLLPADREVTVHRPVPQQREVDGR